MDIKELEETLSKMKYETEEEEQRRKLLTALNKLKKAQVDLVYAIDTLQKMARWEADRKSDTD